jgi:hypothetical protein
MQQQTLTLSILPDLLAVCRLPAHEPIPAWTTRSTFFSITRTSDELSIVCDVQHVPPGIRCEQPWRAFKIEGPLPFELTGILLSVAAPLADAHISIFALATFDTDYVLVRDTQWEAAKTALSAAGHRLLP